MNLLDTEFPKLLFDLEPAKMMKTFNKKKYDASFHAYYDAHKSIYELLKEQYTAVGKNSEELAKITIPLVEKAKKLVKETGFLTRKRYLMDLNCMLAFFVLPGIVESGEDEARMLAELLVESWRRAFADVTLGIAAFAEINDGFRQTKLFGFSIGDKN